MNTVIYLGVGYGFYHLCKGLWRGWHCFRMYLKSFSNSYKYLKSKSTPIPNKGELTYSAVIYGANTKVGKIYAQLLAKKGFNLILIERNIETLT